MGRPSTTPTTPRVKAERPISVPVILERESSHTQLHHCHIITITTPLYIFNPAAYSHPAGTHLIAWSVEDVGDFLTSLGYEAYLDRFVEHEIDGKALSLVKDHHLLMTLKLRLGPTLKICEHVNAIKAIEECPDEG